MVLDLNKAAQQFLADRKRGFSHDRTKTVGASEIGQCARRVGFEKKLGSTAYDPKYRPADGAAFRGDLIEEHWTVPIIQRAVAAIPPAQLIWAGSGQQHTIEVPNWFASCTPDGLIVNAPATALAHHGVALPSTKNEIVVEMKSFDPRKEERLPIQTHVDQLQYQLGLIRAEGQFQPLWGLLVYVNASFLDDVREFPVRYDKLKFESQIRRAMHIMNAPNPELLRPEGKISGGKECEYCPFADRCKGYVPFVPPNQVEAKDIEPSKMQRIRSAVGSILNAKRQIADLEARLATAEAALKEALASAGTKLVEGKLNDGRWFKAIWKKTNGRSSFNRKAAESWIRDHGGDPEIFITKGQPGEQLEVKEIKPKATEPQPGEQLDLEDAIAAAKAVEPVK